jgi:hypothetical protein
VKTPTSATFLLVKTPTRAKHDCLVGENTNKGYDIADIYDCLVGENTNKGYDIADIHDCLVGENTNKGYGNSR